MVGVTVGSLNVAYDRWMMSFSAFGGISVGEMYRLKIWKASSSKDRLSHSFCQCGGRDGIASGMNSPLSDARPLRTASSKESWRVSELGIDLIAGIIYVVGPSTGTKVPL